MVDRVEGVGLPGEPMRIENVPTPPEGVQRPDGVGRVGRDVLMEELKGAFLAGGMSSGVLQGGHYGVGGCVELCTAWMGPKRLQVFCGRLAEESIVIFEMPVHLVVRRMGVVGDKGWAEVPTEDGEGFGQGTKHPDSKRTRPLLGKG